MTATRSLLALALPIALAQLAKRVMSVTDAVWLGTVGIDAINAVAAAISLELFPFFIGFAFSQGLLPDIARADKLGDPARVRELASRSLTTACCVGALVAAIVWTCPGAIRTALTIFPSIDPQLGYHYIRYSSLGYPAAYGNVLLIFLLASSGESRYITAVYALLCTLNFALDYAACTLSDDPRYNVAGLALATAVCRSITFVALLRHIRAPARPRLHPRCIAGWSRILSAGIPITGMKIGMAASAFLALKLIEPHGAEYFAAYNLGERLFELVMAVFIGLETALLYRLSGSSRADRRGIRREYARITLAITAVFSLAVFAAPVPLLARWLGEVPVAHALRLTAAIKAASIPLVAVMIYAQTRQRMTTDHIHSSLRVLAAAAGKLAVVAALYLARLPYLATLALLYTGLATVEPVVFHGFARLRARRRHTPSS